MEHDKDVTLRELLAAMHKYKDDETFRYFHSSIIHPATGALISMTTLRVSIGQARKELGLTNEG